MKKKRLLSLFSGCGGMDLGFEGGFDVPFNIYDKSKSSNSHVSKTGFETVFANDINEKAKIAWEYYFKKNIFHCRSIVDIVKDHKNGLKVFPNDIDIVTGGFPCQDFSVAGKRNGFKSHKDHNGKVINCDIPSTETRGLLYMWMKEVVEITKPKVFIAENVKGLANLGDVKDIIQKDFSSIDNSGYFVFTPKILLAADYGVPQSRERIFFIGIKKSAVKKEILNIIENNNIPKHLDPYPTPTHSKETDLFSLNKNKHVTLDRVLLDLKEPEEAEDLSQKHYSKAKFMGVHCQGQKEISLHKIAPTIRSEHHGNIEFRRLSKENGGIIESEFNLNERRLTIRECARIQSFPDNYEFVIKGEGRNKFELSPSVSYKLIGNAVPPLLANSIAKRIEEIWDIYFK